MLIVWFHLYDVFTVGKPIATENILVIAHGWEYMGQQEGGYVGQ